MRSRAAGMPSSYHACAVTAQTQGWWELVPAGQPRVSCVSPRDLGRATYCLTQSQPALVGFPALQLKTAWSRLSARGPMSYLGGFQTARSRRSVAFGTQTRRWNVARLSKTGLVSCLLNGAPENDWLGTKRALTLLPTRARCLP